MAMIIAWNFLNKVTHPTDARFSRHALVIAPGLTVKSRLQVLHPAHENIIRNSDHYKPLMLL